MNEENQNFADYVSQISAAELESDHAIQGNDMQLDSDYASQIRKSEVLYDSDYNDSTFNPDSIESVTVYPNESAAVCNLNECNLTSCDLDDGELTCGDDFADNGDTIQGGPCQDLMEYFSDKPYLD